MPHIAECFADLVCGIRSQHLAQLCKNMPSHRAAAHKQAKHTDYNNEDGRQGKSGEKRCGSGHPERVVLLKLAEGLY